MINPINSSLPGLSQAPPVTLHATGISSKTSQAVAPIFLEPRLSPSLISSFKNEKVAKVENLSLLNTLESKEFPKVDLPLTRYFRNFENIYAQVRVGKKCPPMNMFNQDEKLIHNLLKSWTLDGGVCFFDLLIFDIYVQWKDQGGSKEDLQKLCQYCKRLSIEMQKSVRFEINPTFFTAMHAAFKALEIKIPKALKPNFQFLLKVLSHPVQAIALGSSSVDHFECNEVLNGESTRREDVMAFMDFAFQMHPKEFAFIKTSQFDIDLSRQMNSLLKALRMRPDQEDVATNDLYNFVTLLKRIIDRRFLQKSLSTGRLFSNIQGLNKLSSKYKLWIQLQISNYLGSEYSSQAQSIIANIYSSSKGYAPKNEVYIWMNYLANASRFKSLRKLELEIVKKLESDRKTCKDPEIYAQNFSEMVGLYQIVHDSYFLQDVANDQLNGKEIPQSLTNLAFLPKIDALGTCTVDEEVGLAQHPMEKENVPDTAFKPVQDTESTIPKEIPQKNCLESSLRVPFEVNSCERLSSTMQKIVQLDQEEKRPNVSRLIPLPVVEKPDFPRKNVAGRDVIRHLLNNNFVINHTTGGHYQLEHVQTNVKVTIPYHESIKPGTLRSIRQAFYLSQGISS